MILELLLVFGVILGVCLVAYKGAVHEFQLVQKDWISNLNWSSLLGEGVPLVVRNVAPEWMGYWRFKSTARKSWHVQVKEGDRQFATTWSEWIQSAPGQPPFQNGRELANVAKIPAQTWMDGGFCRWSWLAPWSVEAHVLGPTEDTFLPAYKTTAVCTVFQSTDGAPLQIWLAHEGAVSSQVVNELRGKNPWNLRSSDVPWMEEVKFVEVKLRPGNALAIPAHWWVAARPMFALDAAPTKMADGAWFWSAEFHSPISYFIPSRKK